MARCVTCGSELHPERAAKYDYCTRRDCWEQNAKGLMILAVGVNKAADQYEVVDGRTRAETAGYADHDRRLASLHDDRGPVRDARPADGGSRPGSPRRPWSKPQQSLARIYNARGMRPDEIARKLDLSTGVVIQMLLAAKRQPSSP
jgi:hypothetical protein